MSEHYIDGLDMCGAMIRHKPLQRHNLDVQHWFTAKFAYQSIIDMVCIYILYYTYTVLYFFLKKNNIPRMIPKLQPQQRKSCNTEVKLWAETKPAIRPYTSHRGAGWPETLETSIKMMVAQCANIFCVSTYEFSKKFSH